MSARDSVLSSASTSFERLRLGDVEPFAGLAAQRREVVVPVDAGDELCAGLAGVVAVVDLVRVAAVDERRATPLRGPSPCASRPQHLRLAACGASPSRISMFSMCRTYWARSLLRLRVVLEVVVAIGEAEAPGVERHDLDRRVLRVLLDASSEEHRARGRAGVDRAQVARRGRFADSIAAMRSRSARAATHPRLRPHRRPCRRRSSRRSSAAWHCVEALGFARGSQAGPRGSARKRVTSPVAGSSVSRRSRPLFEVPVAARPSTLHSVGQLDQLVRLTGARTSLGFSLPAL